MPWTFRHFPCHQTALTAQDMDRARKLRVSDWFAYKGVTTYMVNCAEDDPRFTRYVGETTEHGKPLS